MNTQIDILEENQTLPNLTIMDMPGNKVIDTTELQEILFKNAGDVKKYNELNNFVEYVKKYSQECTKNNFKIQCVKTATPSGSTIALNIEMGPVDAIRNENTRKSGHLHVDTGQNLQAGVPGVNLNSVNSSSGNTGGRSLPLLKNNPYNHLSTVTNTGTNIHFRKRHGSDGSFLDKRPQSQIQQNQLPQLITLPNVSQTTINLPKVSINNNTNSSTIMIENSQAITQGKKLPEQQLDIEKIIQQAALNDQNLSPPNRIEATYNYVKNPYASMNDYQKVPMTSFNSLQTHSNDSGIPESLYPQSESVIVQPSVPNPSQSQNNNTTNRLATPSHIFDFGITHLPTMIVQDWHTEILPELRNHLIKKILTNIYPQFNINHQQEVIGQKLIDFSKKIEADAFDNSISKNEYYDKLSDQIHKIRMELCQLVPKENSASPKMVTSSVAIEENKKVERDLQKTDNKVNSPPIRQPITTLKIDTNLTPKTEPINLTQLPIFPTSNSEETSQLCEALPGTSTSTKSRRSVNNSEESYKEFSSPGSGVSRHESKLQQLPVKKRKVEVKLQHGDF